MLKITAFTADGARLSARHRPLLMLAVLLAAFSLLGLWLDPRLITGAPAWLKPAKFAVSTAIYAFTLAWVFSYLREWPRTRAHRRPDDGASSSCSKSA